MNRKNARLKEKLLYTGLIITIYILGKNIPIPWVARQPVTGSTGGDLLSMIRLVLGSSSDQVSVLELDLAPWMTASILVQLFSLAKGRNRSRVSPVSVRRKTGYLALLFAVVNAGIRTADLEFAGDVFGSIFLARFVVIATMTAGAFFVLWLAGQNKEKGIGGVVCIIFVNILRNLTEIVGNAVSDLITGETDWRMGLLMGLLILLGVCGMIVMCILENGEIRLPVQRVLIDSEMDQENYLAMKTNPAGTQALMYVMAFYLVPYYLVTLFQMLMPDNRMLSFLAERMNLYHPLGLAVYVAMYVLIAVALAYVQMDPSEVAQQMQEKGDCLMGVRPGRETEAYLSGILLPCSLISSLILGIFITISLSMRIFFDFAADLAMLPILMMILTGIMQNILAEARALKVLDQYTSLLG